MADLLQAEGLAREFKTKAGTLRAVDDVSLSIPRGKVLALVGESGSGKTTTGRLILRLLEPTRGKVLIDGTDFLSLRGRDLRRFRRRIQPVFQDPFASLSPHMRIGDALAEALVVQGLGGSRREREERVQSILEVVGLSGNCGHRYPHEFSGGQRQRIGIARALIVEPDLVVADEPVSALDVSIQAQIINLIEDLRSRLGLTMLLVAHDLGVVRHVADHVAVMYLGRIVEIAPTEMLFRSPRHPYTRALLSASPIPEARSGSGRIVLEGEIPSPISPPSGCAFRTRCPHASDACASQRPTLESLGQSHQAACVRVEQF